MKRNRASASFMTRLGRDQRGNTIAIVAAAIVPLLGMIGGGIDMSRLYLAKTRLQQACDAGALAGRKAMGSGVWSEGTPASAKSRAEELFRANFATGAYGTTLISRTFDGAEGTVTGTATVDVPMSVMKIFGMTKRTLSVECSAKMEIPNTDVMFVLDVTGSMNCAPGATCSNNGNVPATGAKLYGLKSAVKCFYEALLKVNTPEVCSTSPSSPDPTTTAYNGTAHIRLGFVPYAVNVNVGKLLPHDYIADSWAYQSRVARPATMVRAWTLGTETAVTGWNNWPAAPTNRNNQSSYSGWTDIGTSGGTTVSVNGNSRTKRPTGKTSTTCDDLNTIGTSTNKMLDYVDTGNVQNETSTTTNNPPTYPAPQQVLNYSQNDIHNVVGYKYAWVSSSCRLQSGTRGYTLTRTGKQTTKAINWATYDSIPGWTSGRTSFNVSGLKKAGTTDEWLDSITLPLDETSRNVTLSGSNTSTNIKTVTDRTVNWDGCIEERKTFKNTDSDPSNDWGTIPSTALDMNIDLIPSDADSRWGPLLPSALQPVSTDYYCPKPSRKLAEYYTAAQASDFVSYINGLTFTGVGTYHDIGMIWGARLLSPTGIFADENDYTSEGGNIQRHLIFMTDGKAQTFRDNYGAYGITCIDLRQLNSCPSNNNTTNARMDSLVNARLAALCERIKDEMNIKLWVISYGGGVDAADETRLETCASPGHFYSAANGPALIAKFKQIAAEIADLRLAS